METNQDRAEIARLNKEVQLWQGRFRAAVDMLVLFSKERDEAVRRADAAEAIDEIHVIASGPMPEHLRNKRLPYLNLADYDEDEPEDYDVCYKCGACVRSLCHCFDRNFDVTI